MLKGKLTKPFEKFKNNHASTTVVGVDNNADPQTASDKSHLRTVLLVTTSSPNQWYCPDRKALVQAEKIMFRMEASQIEKLEDLAAQSFEDDMVIHARSFSPRLSTVLGEEGLRLAVRGALSRARDIRLCLRGSIRTCVELSFLCGSGFIDDPQYPTIGTIFLGPGEEMARAEKVYEQIVDYQANVSGDGASNLHAALHRLLAFCKSPPPLSEDNLEEQMLAVYFDIYPQKAEYIGQAPLRALIKRASSVARQHGFDTPRARALMACLMLGFGHRCVEDPLYPWIGSVIEDPRIVDRRRRAERLERKAITWLDHVVAGNDEITAQGDAS